jgi:DNA ligase-1
VGKKNETSAYDQACSEAQSKWTKQIERKGYVQERARAEKGERNQANIPPMLAPTTGYEKNKKKISFPAAEQPKLDGIRCEAMIEDGEVTLWSRTGKPITAVPHIVRALKAMFPGGGSVILDGELYNHDYHDEFEEICSIVRDQTEIDVEEIMQYHIYDIMDEGMKQQDRLNLLEDLFNAAAAAPGASKHLFRVPHVIVNSEAELWAQYERYMEELYEGGMVRNLDALYEPGKRSSNLQKIKKFDETECKIVAVNEGRGKMAGKAIFTCVYEDRQFDAKMKGKLSNLIQYLTHPELAIGKMLTVKHFGLTKANVVPRFPVGKAIRDYE